jgi:hypothetical protein
MTLGRSVLARTFVPARHSKFAPVSVSREKTFSVATNEVAWKTPWTL